MTQTAIKERPILFSAPMVRAILDGSKTQTRRVIPGRIWEDEDDPGLFYYAKPLCRGRYDMNLRSETVHSDGKLVSEREYKLPVEEWMLEFSPYGKPGDRLWVRETWAAQQRYDDYQPRDIPKNARVWRLADGQPPRDGFPDMAGVNRPSIFMPRWASRILLEVTDVRVERVQEISEADAIAEGIERPDKSSKELGWAVDAKQSFRILWDSINAKRGYSWESNPWVWAVTFKRIEASDETH